MHCGFVCCDHLTKIEEKSLDPKGNPPGTAIASEDPKRKGGRNIGEVSTKYSKLRALPVIQS